MLLFKPTGQHVLTVGKDKLSGPRDVAFDSDGRIYVADTGHHAIQAPATPLSHARPLARRPARAHGVLRTPFPPPTLTDHHHHHHHHHTHTHHRRPLPARAALTCAGGAAKIIYIYIYIDR